MSRLDFKLRSFRIEPQTTTQALANIKKLKDDLGLKSGKKVSKARLRSIYKHTGSFTDEVIETREKETA